jgi:sodium/proline symporter
VTLTALTFLVALAAFVAIGVASVSQSTPTTEDYLVAGRSVPPALAALSSVATNNSGFMFVGLIGWTYAGGLYTAWMALAWILGDACAWLFVHRRVREDAGETEAESVPGLLGAHVEDPDREDRPVVVLAAIATLVFLGGYAAAQLQAGSLALEALFGWSPAVGVGLGGVAVGLYCLAGGLRASIWTDAAQSVVMLVSMGLLLAFAVVEVGGLGALHARLAAIDPALVDPRPPEASLGVLAWFGGYAFGGFGAVGQPHILVRTMSIRSPEAVKPAGLIYFAWFVPFYAAAVLCALYARVLVPELEGTATEGALPALGGLLLPEVFQGLLLAGLFSATLSTADSQLLSCSAAITHDLVPRWRQSTRAAKAATLSVATVALVTALTASGGVFSLVLGAWSWLAASIGPLVVLRALGPGRRLRGARAVAVMLAGPAVVLVWKSLGLGGAVYAVMPGMVVPLGIGWLLARRPPEAAAQS